jgi:hypothetical protein
MKKSVKQSVKRTAALWKEWRCAADNVWDAWNDLLASTDGGFEPHLRYLLALDDEHLAAHRLAVALAA